LTYHPLFIIISAGIQNGKNNDHSVSIFILLYLPEPDNFGRAGILRVLRSFTVQLLRRQ